MIFFNFWSSLNLKLLSQNFSVRLQKTCGNVLISFSLYVQRRFLRGYNNNFKVCNQRAMHTEQEGSSSASVWNPYGKPNHFQCINSHLNQQTNDVMFNTTINGHHFDLVSSSKNLCFLIGGGKNSKRLALT